MQEHTSIALAAIRAYADRRGGIFTSSAAKGLGMSARTLNAYGLPGQAFRRVFPGVYERADLPPDPLRRILAAELWGGYPTVSSHGAAALVQKLDGVRTAEPEIWSPHGRGPTGIICHRGTVPESEVSTTGLFRHTNPIRTVLDLAGKTDPLTLELIVESVLRLNPKWETTLRASRRPNLVEALSHHPIGAPPTGSELETRYLQVIRPTGLPAPARQHRVISSGGRYLGRLDVCWPDIGLWVELDGRKWHEQPKALLRDRQRQNEIAIYLQWLILRFTWDDVLDHPTRTARQTVAAFRCRSDA